MNDDVIKFFLYWFNEIIVLIIGLIFNILNMVVVNIFLMFEVKIIYLLEFKGIV